MNVSMATDSVFRVIMGKILLTLNPYFFDWIVFILAGNHNNHILEEFYFLPDLVMDCGVCCPLVFGKKKIPIIMRKVVSTCIYFSKIS